MDFILQRRSLIQILLISLLALILTVSLLLGGILLWQGRAESPDGGQNQTPAANTTPTPAAPGDKGPGLSVAATEGGFRVQGSDWPGFSELTLSVLPRNAASAALPIDLGAVVANAKGSFNATFTWAAVSARQASVDYDLVASAPLTNAGNLVARTPFNLAAPLPGNTPPVAPVITAITCVQFRSAISMIAAIRIAFSERLNGRPMLASSLLICGFVAGSRSITSIQKSKPFDHER